MEFGVLGTVRLVVEGRVRPIASARQRAVFAVLLLSANRSVSMDRLIDAVWGEHPPGSAQNLVRTYVWRLRMLLADGGEARLVTDPAGYLLRVRPGELDLADFERLLGEGKAALARDEASTAAESLRAALTLWRGEPLGDVTLHDPSHQAEVRRLSEARIAGLEERIEADLAVGRHEDLIGELQQLTAQHLLRERIAGQLMIACYRSSRQADALLAYHEIRSRLREQLGMDPCPELQELHQRILRADADLRFGRARRRASERIVPRQLPIMSGDFAGRTAELKALTTLRDRAARGGGILMITALDGTAGIGKTTLAIYWGRQNQDRFPDGQLYVNLRGFAPGARPMAPAEAIRGFLDALAVLPDRIPQDLDAQAALYRSLLDGKRMLIILDNARDTDQVRPLLAGSPTCLTLVTSRNRLTGLIAAEAAHPIALGLPTYAEARELLTQRLGLERARAEPDAITQLIDLSARLPLALSIAAARATLSATRPLAELVAELRDVRNRLDALDIGDNTTDLRAVFFCSYQHLSATAARMFRMLGIHSGPDISAPAAASLVGISAADSRSVLAELVQARLLTEHTPARFTFHDLLRAYAAEQAQAHDTDAQRHEAIHRALDHYLHTAYAADQLLRPAREDPIVLGPSGPGVTPEVLADSQEALEWLEAEHQVLLAVITQAVKYDFNDQAWQLPWTLDTFFDRRGHWHDYAATQNIALAAARRLGDQDCQARTHQCLGWYYSQLGDRPQAQAHCRKALDLYHQLGDSAGQARAYRGLSWILDQQGHPREALDYTLRALDLYRSVGHKAGEIGAVTAMGWLHSLLGDYQQAMTYCQLALDMQHAEGDTSGQAHAWDSLGFTHHRLGQHGRALACYQRALDLFRIQSDRYYQATILSHIGDTHHATCNPDEAHNAWQQALSILDKLNHPDAEPVRDKLRHHQAETPDLPTKPTQVQVGAIPEPDQI